MTEAVSTGVVTDEPAEDILTPRLYKGDLLAESRAFLYGTLTVK